MFFYSLRFISFCLFASIGTVLTGGETADKPLHLKQAWSVNDNGILERMAGYFKLDNREECRYGLPEEIDETAHWGGVVLTDGEELYPVVVVTITVAVPALRAVTLPFSSTVTIFDLLLHVTSL